jgi:hypothetical protein
MKRATSLCAAMIVFATASFGAQNFGVYWVGNSLMCGGWGGLQGWDFVGKAMINPDSTRLGFAVHSAATYRGATDIPYQWKGDLANDGTCQAIDELNSPTGCISYGYPEPWCATRDNYDYIALQGYRWTYWGSADLSADTEYKYCSLYYDLGLSKGTKPIIFACWQNPPSADTAIAIYDSLYRKYRGSGAIYAPVIQAHRLVWNDSRWANETEMTNFLYDNDPYHHVNRRGAFLGTCVFFEVFTGASPVGITKTDLKRVGTSADIDSVSDADVSYLEAKAHQAVVNYYGAGKSPHLGMAPVAVHKPVAPKDLALYTKSGTKVAVDLAGHAMTHNAAKGVDIALDATGRASRVVTVHQ